MSAIAVTGCSGYIGSRLLGRLDRDDTTSRIIGIDVRPPAVSCRKLDMYRMDIRDGRLSELLRSKGVERVVHLAFVVDPIRDEALMHDIDVRGSRNVLRAAADCGARQVVVASSTTAFGALPDNPEWLSEDTPVRRHPDYTYASDKYEVEGLVRDFAEANTDVKVAVVRPCIVYGPNVSNYLSRFLFNMPVLPAVGDARPEMQFVHEDDVAEVFGRVLDLGATGCFHAVGRGTIGLDRIAEIAGRRIVGLPERFIYPFTDFLWRHRAPRIEGPSGMLDFIRYRWTASDCKTRDALDFEPRYSSEETVRITVDTHR